MTDHPLSTASSPLIVTDAACDLPPDVFAQYGIRVAPLKILFGGESFLSGVDITHAEFYARLGQGKVDLTIGSALDIFGGSGVKYDDCVKFNRRQKEISGGG